MISDLTGQQFGKYRLVRLLGSGGFASVYLGQHILLSSQQAAIKILHLHGVDLQHFQAEAEMTAKLLHPHIVRLLDFDFQQGTPYLVLDYAPQGSLAARHPYGQKVPLSTVVAYLKQITQALQFAHDLHVVHRDLKPDNILIGRQGELLLSDFGIAVLSQTGHTSFDSVYGKAGTAYYMAPEMFRSKPEKASDQYSLAVIVYEWLCGKLPFPAGDFIQLGFQHSSEPVPPLRQYIPTLPIHVEDVILKALSKQPCERFPSVQAFVQTLEEALQPPEMEPAVLHRPRLLSPIKRGQVLLMYKNHTDTVNAVAWSPNGSRLASASYDKTAHVWDANSGHLLLSYTGHTDTVGDVAWSPDGRRIASASADKAVRIWDASNGCLLLPYTGHTRWVWSLAWSPDGSRLASASYDKTVHVWDTSSGRLLLTYKGHTRYVSALAWSPNGNWLASCSDDQTVHVWEASNGRLLLTYTGHTQAVNAVAWSPNSNRLASCSDDQTVQIWNASNGRTLLTYTGHAAYVNAVAWAPDGNRLASASLDKTVQVWEMSNGHILFTYTGHTRSVHTVAWSPDGSRIASGSRDMTVHVWQAI